MWDYVIEKHGRQEFEQVYQVIRKYKGDRFSDVAQKSIAEESDAVLRPLGMTDPARQAELIGLVSSFMIIEEFKHQ